MRLCKFIRSQYLKSPQKINQMGKQFKESTTPPPQKKNVKGGKANQGVPRDFSISYSDELEFQSNFNLQVGLVQFHILLHHCQG